MGEAIAENGRLMSKQAGELKNIEIRLEMKEKALSDKELELIKIEKSFKDRERQLVDRYATLERAIKEKL